MGSAFSKIAFTAKVKALQEQLGSREAYGSLEQGPVDDPDLGVYETAFIEARDSFYLGTVSETGWPYVQHRGGPPGFLKVLDPRTLGYADFTGNRQYISTGNLAGDDRVSLFLMDYPHQARLKILGRARVIDEEHESELLARLDNPHYRARVERGIVIRVEGFDWNCPKYITPRYTEAEVAARIREVTAAQEAQKPSVETPVGHGELELTITGMHQLTPRIRAYELRADARGELPPAPAGAHLEVPVRLADGSVVRRHYSLVTHPGRHDRYEIAVLREPDGRGGSRSIHERWHLGTRLRVSAPVNHFPLHTDARPAVLIAGGIGITPIKAMAEELKARGNRFELHYGAKTPAEMAFRDELEREFPAQLTCYFSQAPHANRMHLPGILRSAPADALIYVCGPGRLIEAARRAARDLNMPAGRLQYESFD